MNHYKKINYLTLLLSLVVVLIASCAKDGAMGPKGAQGDVGVNGTTGATGTPNVIYSNWITPAAYTAPTIISGQNHSSYTINDAAITQGVLDSGTVVVYGKLVIQFPLYQVEWPVGQVAVLPILFNCILNNSLHKMTWSPIVTLGHIKIDYTDDLNFYNNAGAFQGSSFRYVIIPGRTHTLGSINPKNYQQVTQALHIPD